MSDSVVELRQYTLRPGQRDVLVDIFERHFVTGQESLGMRIPGRFHDLDDPDRFVWLRTFPDMAARVTALTRFYYEGEAWRTHGPAANATMLDSDNVLLLRPAGAVSWPPAPFYLATIHPDREFYEQEVRPILPPTAELVASLETEPAENNFPQLPVRTDGPHFVWFTAVQHENDLDIAREWSLRLAPVPKPAPQRQEVPEEHEPGQRTPGDPRAHLVAQHHGQDQQQ